MEKLVYCAKEVAEILNLSVPSVYKGIKSGTIPSIRYGRVIRIPAYQLKQQLDAGRN